MTSFLSRCITGLALAASAAMPSHAAFITFESAGLNPEAITPTRDAFRVAIGGGTTPGANGSFGGLRREINWDGVPDSLSDPNLLPANFFNVNSPRGVVLSTTGTGFLVSAGVGNPTSTPVLFGFSGDFQTFSAQKLFTAVNSNITDVRFFVPGTTTQATTSAFGLVFTDVEVAALTQLLFFDIDGALIYTRNALVSGNQGLSFVGAAADAGERIAQVRIISGNNTFVSNGVVGSSAADFVVMDDFLYAEPTAFPITAVAEPGSLMLAALALLAFGAVHRVRRHGPLPAR